jgi:uncharacterized Ntn-hydrolase superfamily protein
VDDHPAPVPELHRLMGLQRLYFPDEGSLEFISIDDELAQELRSRLGVGQGATYDTELRDRLYAYVGTENLEERWSDDAQIEVEVLKYLRANT